MTERSSEHADLQGAIPRMILCGASVRAAAESAAAAGVKFWCTDLFHDVDLCDVVRLHGGTLLPQPATLADLLPILQHLDSSIPLLCCGGMENEPELLEQLEQGRPLLGPSAAAVRRLRDPFWLQEMLNGTAVQLAKTVAQCPVIPDGWLLKPLNSAGGIGIRSLDQSRVLHSARLRNPACFQQRIAGLPFSVMVRPGNHGQQLSGAALQLSGWSELCAQDYEWCGVVGPFALPQWLHRQLLQTAILLAEQSGAVGVWGMDLMLTEQGPVLLEVNPRVPASFWLHELQTPGQLIRDVLSGNHTVAGRQTASALCSPIPRLPATVPSAQLVLRSRSDLPATGACPDAAVLTEAVRIADRPQPGQTMVAGSPICSLLFPAVDAAGEHWQILTTDSVARNCKHSQSSHSWDFEQVEMRLNRTVHEFLQLLTVAAGNEVDPA